MAAERALQREISYAGEVTPQEAYQLHARGEAKIIDVRSKAEYELVGRVPQSTLIPWKHWPSGELNAEFLPTLQQHCTANDTVLFLCRSGVRSHAAAIAAAKAGYRNAFNILEGFEGDLDPSQQRGGSGWRKAGLPWVQN